MVEAWRLDAKYVSKNMASWQQALQAVTPVTPVRKRKIMILEVKIGRLHQMRLRSCATKF